MSKIIIGIHGLKNKPPKNILKKWWKLSIREGLRAIGHPRYFFKFELVYWADLLHPAPADPNDADKQHPSDLEERYVPAKEIIEKRPSKVRTIVLHLLERQIEKIFLNEDMSINFSAITDLIMSRFFKDLDIYYSKTCLDRNNQERPAKEVLREELAKILLKHQKKEILLIGHSMGSIIAYDVLTHMLPDIKIDTFITLGSPLGMPVIINKILSEKYTNLNKTLKVMTPENIQKYWYNFADLSDKVAMNFDLADNYHENSSDVKVVDYIVNNTYEINGHRNPHKIYGYLRTPQFSRVIDDFLSRDKTRFRNNVSDKINWAIESILMKNYIHHDQTFKTN